MKTELNNQAKSVIKKVKLFSFSIS